MGESITEGTIASLEKGAGEWAEADELILVIETDKVSVEVRAPHAGVVTQLLAGVDEAVQVGAPLYMLDADAARPRAARRRPRPRSRPRPSPAAAPRPRPRARRRPRPPRGRRRQRRRAWARRSRASARARRRS